MVLHEVPNTAGNVPNIIWPQRVDAMQLSWLEIQLGLQHHMPHQSHVCQPQGAQVKPKALLCRQGVTGGVSSTPAA